MKIATLKNGQNREVTATLGQKPEWKEAVVSDPHAISDIRVFQNPMQKKEGGGEVPYFLSLSPTFPQVLPNGQVQREARKTESIYRNPSPRAQNRMREAENEKEPACDTGYKQQKRLDTASFI